MRPGTGLAVVALLAVVVAACKDYDPRDYDEDPPPSASPTVSAAPTAAADATLHVVLTQANAKDVSIDVTDGTGTLVAAESGSPGDGASVDPYALVVRNDDPTTLRLTWVGGPCDSANTLSIDESGRQFLLVQPECPGDSIVTDRLLILSFSGPVHAGQIHAVLQDGLDTSK